MSNGQEPGTFGDDANRFGLKIRSGGVPGPGGGGEVGGTGGGLLVEGELTVVYVLAFIDGWLHFSLLALLS